MRFGDFHFSSAKLLRFPPKIIRCIFRASLGLNGEAHQTPVVASALLQLPAAKHQSRFLVP